MTPWRSNLDSLYDKAIETYGLGKPESFCTPPRLSVLRLERANRMLRKVLVPNDRVLDIGCGIGLLAGYLPTDVRYLGMDPNEKFLSYAKYMFPDKMFEKNGIPFNGAIPVCDYVVLLGVLCQLQPGFDNLAWLGDQLFGVFRKGVLVEYQNAEKYKGSFTKESREEIHSVFGPNLLLEEFDLEDSTTTVLYGVVK